MLIFVWKWKSLSCVWLFVTPCGLYSPWNSPGQNTGLVLQGIFPTQVSNPGLLHCRWILYHLSHKESPRILEWVAYPFSRGCSYPGIEPGSPALQADSLPTELWYLRIFSQFFSLAWHKHFCFNFWLLIYFFTGQLLYLDLSIILYFLMLISIFSVNFFQPFVLDLPYLFSQSFIAVWVESLVPFYFCTVLFNNENILALIMLLIFFPPWYWSCFLLLKVHKS